MSLPDPMVRAFYEAGRASRRILARNGVALAPSAADPARQIQLAPRPGPQPYRDAFGYLRCGTCGGVLESPGPTREKACSCPLEVPVDVPRSA